MFEKEHKCCNLFLLCTVRTHSPLSGMVANKTHQRTPPLLLVAFQTFEHRPFNKWTIDSDLEILGNISTWECSHVTFNIVNIPLFKTGKYAGNLSFYAFWKGWLMKVEPVRLIFWTIHASVDNHIQYIVKNRLGIWYIKS